MNSTKNSGANPEYRTGQIVKLDFPQGTYAAVAFHIPELVRQGHPEHIIVTYLATLNPDSMGAYRSQLFGRPKTYTKGDRICGLDSVHPVEDPAGEMAKLAGEIEELRATAGPNDEHTQALIRSKVRSEKNIAWFLKNIDQNDPNLSARLFLNQ